MNRSRRCLLAILPALVAGTAISASGCAIAYENPGTWVSGGVAAVEIVDRTSGSALGVYPSRGDRFVVGAPGNEYRIRIRNLTGARVLAVASVDGVNIVSGDSASPSQSGYVLAPWETLDVDGWRTSLAKTAAFYFTTLADSYATRTGRPNDLGVIGVAVFRERPHVIEYRTPSVSREDAPNPERMQKRAERDRAPAQDAMSAPAAAGIDSKSESADRAASPSAMAQGAMKTAPSIGTGYGRDETSYAQRVAFERATSTPVEVLAVRYDSRENLLAMGVLPRPRMIGRAPDPFPGTFVAPPTY